MCRNSVINNMVSLYLNNGKTHTFECSSTLKKTLIQETNVVFYQNYHSTIALLLDDDGGGGTMPRTVRAGAHASIKEASATTDNNLILFCRPDLCD